MNILRGVELQTKNKKKGQVNPTINSLALQSLKDNVLAVISISLTLGFVDSFLKRGANDTGPRIYPVS